MAGEARIGKTGQLRRYGGRFGTDSPDTIVSMKLEPFSLERYFANHEFSAPYLLCSSDCESMSVGELLGLEPGSKEALHLLSLGYTESRGDPALRTEIAMTYDSLGADDILVHSGAEEAIFTFMNVAVKPGDRIIVHSPYYQSLGAVAQAIGAEVVAWEADPDRDWALDLQFLRDRVTSNTSVVVVNVPHNPTGSLPPESFVHELSQLSDQHAFIVLADEVYRGLEYDPADRLPAFADINKRAVSLSVMSKAYGLAGLRIGWLATQNKQLYDGVAGFKDYTTICNSAPSEFLATLALRQKTTIVERNLALIKDNLDRLDEFFGSNPGVLEWYRPAAGSVAFPRYLGESVADFCDELVREAGVLLVPGTLYGDRYSRVRIGFGRRNLPDALGEFGRYLARTRS